MARRPLQIMLYVAGAAAVAAIIAGTVAELSGPADEPMPPPPVAQADPPPAPAPAGSLVTTSSPAVASNGRLTIRVVRGQPEN